MKSQVTSGITESFDDNACLLIGCFQDPKQPSSLSLVLLDTKKASLKKSASIESLSIQVHFLSHPDQSIALLNKYRYVQSAFVLTDSENKEHLSLVTMNYKTMRAQNLLASIEPICPLNRNEYTMSSFFFRGEAFQVVLKGPKKPPTPEVKPTLPTVIEKKQDIQI